MKVYGHPMSTCTRKVLTTLIETGTPFDVVLLDFTKGEHKQTAHLARQPFGQMPVLDDDGFELYESRAICRYLDEKANGPLRPGDVRGRARMEQWISIEMCDFSPAAMKPIFHHVFHAPQDAAVLAAATATLATALDVMDARLGGTPYFAGDRFSIADICFMPYVEYLMATPVKETIEAHANVAGWWTRVSERPSWQRVSGRAT